MINNGGICTPDVFTFVEYGSNSDSLVQLFYAIGSKVDPVFSLEDIVEIFKIDEKRMPSHMLPIGCDPCGNQICLSCHGDDCGAVYFWDHENEVDYTVSGDDDYSNLHLIAPSFEEFLKGLHDVPRAE